MKYELIDDVYIVYLNKQFVKDVDFKIKKEVENCFKDVFLKLKKHHEINGFYRIKVYLNDDITILYIEKENIEYYDYFSNQVDMQIEIVYDSIVLLQFDELYDIKNFNDKVYYYNNKFYIKYIDDIELLEFSKIIYGELANYVINNGIVYNICDI